MKSTAIRSHSSARCLRSGDASFWRHGEIYRTDERPWAGPASTRPSPQPFDEFPVGYSWASCSPAELASASPTVSYFAVMRPTRRANVGHESSPPPNGLDAEKKTRRPAREKCFSLTSPLIEPVVAPPKRNSREGFPEASLPRKGCRGLSTPRGLHFVKSLLRSG